MDDMLAQDTGETGENDGDLAEVETSVAEDTQDASGPEADTATPPEGEAEAPVGPESGPEPAPALTQEGETDAEPPSEREGEAEAESAPAPAIDTALPDVAPGPRSPEVPWWPFVIYVAAWVGLVAAAVLTLSYDADALPAIQQEPYPYLILGGLVLTLFGPVLALTSWFFTWARAGKGRRVGLLTSALVRGAGVTLLGVLMWWGTLVAVDALRLGIIG